MIKISCRHFVPSTVALLSVLMLMLFAAPLNAKAKAKAGKASKAKAAAKDNAVVTESKAENKASEKAEATTETDTDADEIFTEEELKNDSDKKAQAEPLDEEESEKEPEEDAQEKTDESPLAADSEEDSAEPTDKDTSDDGEVEEVVDVDVLEASDQKKGFFPTEFDGPNAVRRDRGINIFTARTTRPMALTLVIDHRPYMELAGNEAEDVFFDYLGLDGGNLKLGLGLRFGIIEGLDVGLYRLNDAGLVPFDTYEFDVRYAFLKQEKFFVDMSIRAGISWFAQKNQQDAVGGYGELFIDRVFLDMLLVGAGFQFHSDSTNDIKSSADTAYSGAVLGVIEWRMIKQLALVAEVAATVLGYGADYGNSSKPSLPGFSMGLKVLTHRHTFTLMVSNSQFINADGIVANTWRDFSDIIFGFQIFREFNFK